MDGPMIRKGFESLNDAFASAMQKQSEQRARLLDMQHATASQGRKLAALQQELVDLKTLVAARNRRATAPAMPGANPRPATPPSDMQVTNQSELAPIQESPEEPADVSEVKMVYTNAGITFSRELLLSCLNAPSGSTDIRMLPCLEELARELGRPTYQSRSPARTTGTGPSGRASGTTGRRVGRSVRIRHRTDRSASDKASVIVTRSVFVIVPGAESLGSCDHRLINSLNSFLALGARSSEPCR